jgi:hypothetical protein
MIMKRKMLAITALASILLASCSNDEKQIATTGNQLGIVVKSLGTKAVKSAWQVNDELGVFVTGTGYTPAVTDYKYDGTLWASSTADAGIKLTSNSASVYAFYPKTLALSSLEESGTYAVAIPAADDFAATATPDYLWGTGTSVTNLTPGATNVSTLTMHHSLAKISFVINSDGSYPVTGGLGNLTQIKLTSTGGKLATGGTVAVGTGAFSATSAAGTAFTYGGNATINAVSGTTVTAYALVAPVNYTGGDLALTLTIDGKEMQVASFPIAPDWSDAGKNYVYNITVSPTQLKVANSVIITDWTATSVTGLTAL